MKRSIILFLLALTMLMTISSASAETAQQSKVAVGDIVIFGHYEQDNDLTNGTEPIEWNVLAVQGDRALLVSHYGLDAKPYNTSYAFVTWETCSLRKWLNDDFLGAAFSAEEQTAILTTMVDNSLSQGYSVWNTDGGRNTQDRVFLLSCAEANRYFGVTWENNKNIEARLHPTAYAVRNGATMSENIKNADGESADSWWLRSPGYCQLVAAYVYAPGSLNNTSADLAFLSVRPAFWINLGSAGF